MEPSCWFPRPWVSLTTCLFLQSLPVTLYDHTSLLPSSLCLKCHSPVS